MKAGEDHATRLVAEEFKGPAGRLEALFQEHESVSHALSAVVCHPHPLYGGTLHNKVVHRVASTLHGLGAAVLRFNFRGAGRSEGRFDHGRGELDDARAAIAFLRTRHPGARLWVAGFSFGSWIASRLTVGDPEVERLILISPPVRQSDFSPLETATIPKLIVQGTSDTVCPFEELEAAFPQWAEPKKLLRIDGATHFFDKRLKALHEALVEALREPAAEGTSSVG